MNESHPVHSRRRRFALGVLMGLRPDRLREFVEGEDSPRARRSEP